MAEPNMRTADGERMTHESAPVGAQGSRPAGGEVTRARTPASGGRLARRLLGRLANPLAGKELLARMRGPRTFVVATLLLLPLAAIAGGLYAMIAAASSSDVSSTTPVGKLFFAAVT